MEANSPNIIIIMGVSGVGKTTTGELLTEKLSIPFYDADDFHPKSNVAKMKRGEALTDEDRKPWLEILAKKIKKWEKGHGAILACSALKESYRKMINESSQSVIWIYLFGKYDFINERLNSREDHYFNPTLLQSQFEDLEIPRYGIHVNGNQKPEAIVKYIIQKINEDD